MGLGKDRTGLSVFCICTCSILKVSMEIGTYISRKNQLLLAQHYSACMKASHTVLHLHQVPMQPFLIRASITWEASGHTEQDHFHIPEEGIPQFGSYFCQSCFILMWDMV